MNSNQEYYQTDLAFVHDRDFSQIGIDAAYFLIQELKNQGIENGLIVDLGCGTGVFQKTVTEQNFDALGIDYSTANIQLAKRNVPKANFQVASFLEIDLPKSQAFTSIGEVFNYQFDDKNNLKTLEALFQKVYEQLLPNGIFMFDVLNPGSIDETLVNKFILETEDYTLFLTKEGNEEQNILTRDIVLFRKVGDLYRKSHEVHQVYLLKPIEIQTMLEKIGFTVEIIDGYGDFKFRHGLFGILAKKAN
jgi:SAM-dependent methyltransferase